MSYCFFKVNWASCQDLWASPCLIFTAVQWGSCLLSILFSECNSRHGEAEGRAAGGCVSVLSLRLGFEAVAVRVQCQEKNRTHSHFLNLLYINVQVFVFFKKYFIDYAITVVLFPPLYSLPPCTPPPTHIPPL